MKPSIFLPWSYVAPVMRRVSGWCIGLSIAVVLATIAYVLLRKPLQLPRHGWYRWIPLALGLLPLCTIFPFSHWLLRNIRRDWRTSGGRLCTHCGYDVSASPPAGTCPECGKAYDITADAAVWKLSGLDSQNAP